MITVLRDGGTHFPCAEQVGPEGLVAVGGDLSRERLLAAYRHGIFPWFAAGEPVLWWSPDPRIVLFPSKLHLSRALRRTLRRGEFEIRFDTCFPDVIEACAAPRKDAHETWITKSMIHAYCDLHDAGVAHSVEAWRDGTLAGGLYGVALGSMFFGESMFARRTDASKVALVALCRQLQARDHALIDCQVPSGHLERLGATPIPRQQFLARLRRAIDQPPAGPWGVGDVPA